jgi:hypothetical protein
MLETRWLYLDSIQALLLLGSYTASVSASSELVLIHHISALSLSCDAKFNRDEEDGDREGDSSECDVSVASRYHQAPI